MKKRLIILGVITLLILIVANSTISAQRTTNTSNNCNLDHVYMEGEVTGIIFNIHAYYIVEGVNVDFHQESWECTINEESGIHCYLPVPPENVEHHYTLTGKKEGYRTNTVDFYVTDDDWFVWAQVELTPTLSTKTVNPAFLKFLEFFPVLRELFGL